MLGVSGVGSPLVVGTALSPGSVMLSATYAGANAGPNPIVGSAIVVVTSAALVSIAITPSSSSIALGLSQQLTATGTYSDGSVKDLTAAVTWTPSAGLAAATVSNASGSNGLATSVTTGVTTVTATLGSVSASATVTVTSAVLVMIAVTPGAPSVPLGLTQPFTATGTYSDGSTAVITSSVTWSASSVSSPPTATISNASGSQGLATAQALGTTTIAALDPATLVQGTATMTTTAAVIESVRVTPPTPGVQVPLTTQLAATGTYSDGSTLDITSSVTWASSDPTIASVSNASGTSGLVTGIGIGTATLTATDPATGVTGSVIIAGTTLGTFGAVVGAGGGALGGVSNGSGIAVTIPAGALSGTLTITASPVASPASSVIGPVWDMEPSGTRFLRPVTLTLPFTAAELGGAAPTSFTLSTLVAGTWENTSAPNVDTTASTISGTTFHFSQFGLAPVAECPAATTPNPPEWDFFSYHFVPLCSDGTMVPNADCLYGEIILYGRSCDTNDSLCGPTWGIAGLSLGSTGCSANDGINVAFNATTPTQVSMSGASWDTHSLTNFEVDSLTNLAGNENFQVWASQYGDGDGDIQSSTNYGNQNCSTWLYKSHWRSAWAGPGSGPPLPQPAAPWLDVPPGAFTGSPSLGEFNDPTPSLVDVCCASGQTLCNGMTCVDTQTDSNNCGSCGNACSAGFDCVNGACLSVCGSLSYCDSTCVDEQTDPNNCGGCAAASLLYTCPPGASCVGGSCQCPTGQTMCDSPQGLPACVDITTDSNNCGACGNTCPGGTCTSGSCCTGCTGECCVASILGGGAYAFSETCATACSSTQRIYCGPPAPTPGTGGPGSGPPPSGPAGPTFPCPAGMSCVPNSNGGNLGPIGYSSVQICETCISSGSPCAPGNNASCCSGVCISERGASSCQ